MNLNNIVSLYLISQIYSVKALDWNDFHLCNEKMLLSDWLATLLSLISHHTQHLTLSQMMGMDICIALTEYLSKNHRMIL